jgi:MFS family permease
MTSEMDTRRDPAPRTAEPAPRTAELVPGTAEPGAAGTAPGRADDRLLTWPVMLLISCGLLAWTAEGALQPTIPLIVLDRGGDAVLVGIVAAAYALPTLLLRPLIGSRIDRGGHGPIHRVGGAILATSPLGFLLPVLPLTPLVRLVQGVGWALYGTSNNVVMAMLAPRTRRAELTAYFNAAYAIGFLVGPPIGLFLYTGVGTGMPFLFASVFGCLAFVSASLLARAIAARGAGMPQAGTQSGREPSGPAGAGGGAGEPSSDGRRRDVPADPGSPGMANRSGGGPPTRSRRRLGSPFEPSAVAPMLATALFMSTQSLFVPFAPVFARAIDEPVEALALYYPAYALLLAGGQLVSGRVVDRVGRLRAIGIGVTLATFGIGTAIVPGGLVTFALGGAFVALGTSMITPAVGAAVMDRAPAGRLAVTMATYSMGYQLAAGGGGALWGVMIGGLGYPWPFVAAIGLQLTVLAVTRRWLGRPPVGGSAV